MVRGGDVGVTDFAEAKNDYRRFLFQRVYYLGRPIEGLVCDASEIFQVEELEDVNHGNFSRTMLLCQSYTGQREMLMPKAQIKRVEHLISEIEHGEDVKGMQYCWL
jgi:hypothetical protein